MEVYLKYYLVFLNFIGFISMYIDKKRAKRNSWRIRESTLLLIAAFGGSVGSYLGMKLFRHKTKHSKFKYGIPIMMLIQILLILHGTGLLR